MGLLFPWSKIFTHNFSIITADPFDPVKYLYYLQGANSMQALERVTLEATEEELAELKGCSADMIGEYVIDRLHDYCDSLEALNLNPEILMAALLQVYCDVAVEHGDRSSYTEQLEFALEDEWEEHSIH